MTPTSAAFGSVAVNFTSNPITFTASNNGIGNVPVTVTSLALSGANSSMFQIQTGTCGAAPFTLQPNASCQFSVTFRPTSAGNKTASLQVSSAGIVLSRPLTGTGVATTAGPVRRSTPTPIVAFTTLTGGFTAALNLWNLQGWNVLLTEPSVVLNTTGTVTFTGGFNPTWTSNTGGITGLKGVLTLQQGTLVVDGLYIQ